MLAFTTWRWQAEPDLASFFSHNFLLLLILALGLPRLFSLFRTRTESERRYYAIPASQRWQIGAAYFGLIALLVLGMGISRVEINPGPRKARVLRVESAIYQPNGRILPAIGAIGQFYKREPARLPQRFSEFTFCDGNRTGRGQESGLQLR